MDYFDFIKRRLDGNEPGVPGWLGAKEATRPFARHIGVRTPQLYFSSSAHELPSKTFPSEFVIKPAFASTSIGVKLLSKTAPGVYNDITSGETVTVQDLVSEYSLLSERYFDDPMTGQVYVEELLRDRDGRVPPRDIRVYAFQGQIGFILAEDHISGPASASYYDENFELFEDVESRFAVAEGAESLEIIAHEPPPENSAEILAVAKRISVAVPSAFCRIDLYNTVNGVQLGELTFYPGTFFYKNRKLMLEQEANRLGELWSQAEKRLSGSSTSNR